MTEINQSEVDLQAHKFKTEQVWYLFFSSPNMRVYDCDANQSILDQALTDSLLELSVDNIKVVFEECKHQLTRIDAAQQAARRAERAAEVVPTEPAVQEDPTQLPKSITKKALVGMGREEYRQLLKQFGDDKVTERLNEVEA